MQYTGKTTQVTFVIQVVSWIADCIFRTLDIVVTYPAFFPDLQRKLHGDTRTPNH